jgi:hypothetical protein
LISDALIMLAFLQSRVAQIGVPHDSIVENGVVEIGSDERGAQEQRTAEVAVTKQSLHEPAVCERCSLKLRTFQMGVPQLRASEARPLERGAVKVRSLPIRAVFARDVGVLGNGDPQARSSLQCRFRHQPRKTSAETQD